MSWFKRKPKGMAEAPPSSVLRAQFVNDSFIAEASIEPVARSVADGLHMVLAYDLPGTVTIPDRHDVERRGSEDELWEIALEQTRAFAGTEGDPECHEFPNPDGSRTPLWFLEGDDFTATHALWADTFAPPASEHGTLVAVPTEHIVLAHPMRDLGTLSAVNHLLGLGSRMFAEGPAPLSEGVFWLRGGVLERLESHASGDQVRFLPSEDFLRVLSSLG